LAERISFKLARDGNSHFGWRCVFQYCTQRFQGGIRQRHDSFVGVLGFSNVQLLPVAIDDMDRQIPSVARTEYRGVTGAEEDLPMKGVGGVDQLPRLFGHEHDGQSKASSSKQAPQPLPGTRHGPRIEELDGSDDWF